MMEENKADNLSEAAENATEQAEETIQDAAETVKETAAGVVEDAEASVDDAAKAIADTAEDAAETVEEIATEDVTEAAEETAEEAIAAIDTTTASPNEVALATIEAQQPIEDAVSSPAGDSHAAGHEHSNTVTLPIINRTVTVNGGIYTVVFAVLAVITVLEVLSAELFPEGPLRVGILLGLSVAKALMVIYFYMHLQSDNRLFRIVLGLPLIIVLVSLLFLVIVPLQVGYPASPV